MFTTSRSTTKQTLTAVRSTRRIKQILQIRDYAGQMSHYADSRRLFIRSTRQRMHCTLWAIADCDTRLLRCRRQRSQSTRTPKWRRTDYFRRDRVLTWRRLSGRVFGAENKQLFLTEESRCVKTKLVVPSICDFWYWSHVRDILSFHNTTNKVTICHFTLSRVSLRWHAERYTASPCLSVRPSVQCWYLSERLYMSSNVFYRLPLVFPRYMWLWNSNGNWPLTQEDLEKNHNFRPAWTRLHVCVWKSLVPRYYYPKFMLRDCQ